MYVSKYVCTYVVIFIADYQVVIICSNDAEDKRSYIMDYLQFFHRAINIDDQMICKYLKHHLTNRVYEFKKEISASHVDPNKWAILIIMYVEVIANYNVHT